MRRCLSSRHDSRYPTTMSWCAVEEDSWCVSQRRRTVQGSTISLRICRAGCGMSSAARSNSPWAGRPRRRMRAQSWNTGSGRRAPAYCNVPRSGIWNGGVSHRSMSRAAYAVTFREVMCSQTRMRRFCTAGLALRHARSARSGSPRVVCDRSDFPRDVPYTVSEVQKGPSSPRR